MYLNVIETVDVWLPIKHKNNMKMFGVAKNLKLKRKQDIKELKILQKKSTLMRNMMR